jgi:hypothetical protein
VPYLIDGDNLLGTWPGRARDDEARRGLALELERLARRIGRRVVVVFDGGEPPGEPPRPDVCWAGRASADDRILALLRREADPRTWTVVTSDRSLADRCRHLGARTERSDRFRKRLVATAAGGEKPEREPDVDHWLRLFGDG